MISHAIARKLVKNHLIYLRRSRSKDAKSRKSTIVAANEWAERHCNSEVEGLECAKKFIANKSIVSPTSVVILIAAKSMLKLLQNDNLQLSLGAAHGVA